jgi:hypothetical protein
VDPFLVLGVEAVPLISWSSMPFTMPLTPRTGMVSVMVTRSL